MSKESRTKSKQINQVSGLNCDTGRHNLKKIINPMKTAEFLENNKTEMQTNLCFQTHGYFKYIDGWQMTFTQWGNREPRTDQPCVYIDVDGKWKTASCNETINSVCLTSTGTINT